MPSPQIAPERGILIIAGMLIALVGLLKFGAANMSDRPVTEMLRDPFVAESAEVYAQLSSGELTLPKRYDGDGTTIALRVPILVYHSVREPVAGLSAFDRQFEVTPEQFDQQMAYLSERGFETVSFDELSRALAGEVTLPERAIIISMDDGRESQFTNALPILERYDFTATFFPFTNAIGREGYVSWNQLQLLHAHGMEIGSHSVFHPFLTRLSSEEAKRAEIEQSKTALEHALGTNVTAFAHPFGLYDDATNALIKAAGYRAARSLVHDQTHTADDRYALGAFVVTGNFSAFRRIVDDTSTIE